MRPVERIEPMLAKIRGAWYANPDQRLGQLIVNACRDPGHLNAFGYGEVRDPFNIEDDEMWMALDRMSRDARERGET